MKYGSVFLLLGVSTAILPFSIKGLHWLLCWTSFIFAIVGLSYIASTPRLLGKQADGTIALLSVALLLPYFALTWLVWHIQIRVSGEDIYNEIIPGIYLGRRPLAGELPACVERVVDVTSEFREPAEIVKNTEYISYPILDGHDSDIRTYTALLDKIAAGNSPTYIHCAQGHGRSATVVAGILLKRGIVNSPDDAEEYIRTGRPGIGINRTQKRFLSEYMKSSDHSIKL